MIDTEVMRLRKLRNTALRARAFAAVLDSRPARPNSIFARGAQSCWRIARAVTGTLRAHPYLNFQKDTGALRKSYIQVTAEVQGGLARHRNRSLQTYCDELRQVERQLADSRALTWSADLSDTLGRFQVQLRGVVAELTAAARQESNAHALAAPRAMGRAETPAEARTMEENWPYLAFRPSLPRHL